MRGLEREVVVAVSGVAAGLAAGESLPVPLLDVRDPAQLSRLADLVLAG